jgi:hypothetical protein
MAKRPPKNLDAIQIAAEMMAFEQGLEEGRAAWQDNLPVHACPYGPGFRIPEDGSDDIHQGWLFGWWEEEISQRVNAFERNGYAAALDGSKRSDCPANLPRHSREKEGWLKGFDRARRLMQKVGT